MSALLMEVAVCRGFDSAVQNERREYRIKEWIESILYLRLNGCELTSSSAVWCFSRECKSKESLRATLFRSRRIYDVTAQRYDGRRTDDWTQNKVDKEKSVSGFPASSHHQSSHRTNHPRPATHEPRCLPLYQ